MMGVFVYEYRVRGLSVWAERVAMIKRFALGVLLMTGAAFGAAAWAFAPGGRGIESKAVTIIVSEDDGYGVGSCAGGNCGQDVADAWCLANGYAHAVGSQQISPAALTPQGSGLGAKLRPAQVEITCK